MDQVLLQNDQSASQTVACFGSVLLPFNCFFPQARPTGLWPSTSPCCHFDFYGSSACLFLVPPPIWYQRRRGKGFLCAQCRSLLLPPPWQGEDFVGTDCPPVTLSPLGLHSAAVHLLFTFCTSSVCSLDPRSKLRTPPLPSLSQESLSHLFLC